MKAYDIGRKKIGKALTLKSRGTLKKIKIRRSRVEIFRKVERPQLNGEIIISKLS